MIVSDEPDPTTAEKIKGTLAEAEAVHKRLNDLIKIEALSDPRAKAVARRSKSAS